MQAHVIIPAAADDIDALIWRLERLPGILVRLEGDKIILRGDQHHLLPAQNYALRFIGPEAIQCLHVSAAFFSLLHVTGLVRHFEETFNIIVCLRDSQTVILKGRKEDNERFQTILKSLDTQCSASNSTNLTLFKLSNLRLLCDKFNVAFDEVPSEPAVQMCLLTYFSSLLDELSVKHSSAQSHAVSFLEAYRKQVNEPLVPQNVDTVVSESTPPNRARLPSRARRRTQHSKSADRENQHPTNGHESLTNGRLRTVVIDGSNVAFAHGKQKEFSPQGIQLALDFFLRRGHTNVVAVVPRHRQGRGGALFDRLERSGHLCYSPSRFLNDARQVADDDRIILQLAVERDAVVVSNDQFRNYRENEQFKEVIDHRLLQYTLALDTFLVAEDPHGAKKPSLSQLLRQVDTSCS